MMPAEDINENLREACATQNYELFQSLILKGAEINSKNSVNGMTALHWAAVRNDEKMVRYCLESGADPTLSRNDGKLPSNLTKDSNIKVYLKTNPIEEYENTDVECSFIPNYLKNPLFPHTLNNKSNSLPAKECKIIVIKVKLINNRDFIELEVDKSLTINDFKDILRKELDINEKIKLIRKLPDVLVRDHRDILRLKDGNELEVEIEN